VISILDVPLIDSPRTSLTELQQAVPSLLSPRTDIDLARIELTTSPLYRQLLMSTDGHTTALLARFRLDPEFMGLLAERDLLREAQVFADLSTDERRRMAELDERIRELRARVTARQQSDIASVRSILDVHRGRAELHLGGLPMIVTDMLEYIKRDVVVFGAGILVFLIGLMTTIFTRPRWVVLSMLSCFASIALMIGYLGFTAWPVTVVSANFIALLLIFSLSIAVHLIVRYRELHADNPKQNQRWLVQATVRDKFLPCVFTSLTTMIAFASLLASGIRPVIDFGWMMVIGMAVIMLMAFTIFPAGLMLLTPGVPQERRAATGAITGFMASLVAHWPLSVGGFFLATAAAGIFGITQLDVENRFIDNFKDSTEIYQGMVKMDRELGGTTPLDIVIDADPAFFAVDEPVSDDADDEFGDEFDDEFGDEGFEDFATDETDLGSTSYWYNTFQLQTVREAHEWLERQPEIGKVLSMTTTIDTLQTINDDAEVGTFWLSILYKKLPAEVKSALFDPYLSADGNQVRLSVRVFESDKNLRRQELLTRIQDHLTGEMGLAPERVHLTGMLVLYNNVLQSLYRSQVLTLGFVFLVILGVFLVLYRSLPLALIAIVPNLLAAGAVLGLMGLLSIPLDIMTITIAAIVIGIGVDDTIHYLHRFRKEFAADGNYTQAMRRSHGSIGRAMYYTSIIVSIGFSILVLSNFLPTIYFGILTGFAMLFAMFANLTLLPLLLLWLRPLGSERGP
jgi:predicted RND superfamily exporter protein